MENLFPKVNYQFTKTTMKHFSIEKITEDNSQKAIDYLEQHEQSCVTLLSRLLTKQNTFSIYHYFFVYEHENFTTKIIAIIMHSNGGMIQHHIDNPEQFFNDEDFSTCIKQIINSENIYCIMGDKKGSDLLLSIILSNFSNYEISQYSDYLLLSYHPENLPNGLFEKEKYIDNKKNNFEIIQCDSSYLDNILPLQKQYDLLEVIPPHITFNEANCKKNLLHTLQTQTMLAIKADNDLVAKANTNAIGKNFIQIGGVFTNENFRGHNFAKLLVDSLCKKILLQNKQPVLFVKAKNENAKKAYRKVGFTYQSDYSIIYLKEKQNEKQ